MKTVLFLCTGNYYRSRFAETLFNARACERQLAWRAESRGLQLHPDNVGAISRHAVRALRERGIRLSADPRLPLAVDASDLASAHLVVALKETEHRPLLDQGFPEWTFRVEFWHIDDLDVATAAESMPVLEQAISRLVERLAQSAAPWLNGAEQSSVVDNPGSRTSSSSRSA